MDLNVSKTKENLMKAFAGESQARNRYTIAASAAKKEGLNIIQDLFLYTADQERAHAKVFFDYLKKCNTDNIEITGGFPIANYAETIKNLRAAEHGEFEEFSDVYPSFAKVAEEEGFTAIANTFTKIAEIEKCHSERFKKYADLLESNSLFKREADTVWMCTNCGYIYEGKEAPAACPVCTHPQGYFMEFKETKYEK